MLCSIANKHVFIFRQTFHTTLRNGVIPAIIFVRLRENLHPGRHRVSQISYVTTWTRLNFVVYTFFYKRNQNDFGTLNCTRNSTGTRKLVQMKAAACHTEMIQDFISVIRLSSCFEIIVEFLRYWITFL